MTASFWDDESLTDNLNDLQATVLLNWLDRLYYHVPEKFPFALSAVRNLNHLATVKKAKARLPYVNAIQDVLGVDLPVSLKSADLVDRIIDILKEVYV